MALQSLRQDKLAFNGEQHSTFVHRQKFSSSESDKLSAKSGNTSQVVMYRMFHKRVGMETTGLCRKAS